MYEMKCDFESVGGLYRCRNCRRIVKVLSERITEQECAYRPPEMPPVAEQVKNYAKAVVQHVVSGSVSRSDDEVDALLEICRACEFYNQEKERCSVCGCRCSRGKTTWLNKLRMASQHCPKEKW